MNDRLCRPIFIMGTGRSGTTLLVNLLAGHPDLAWFSNLAVRYPSLPQLAFMNNLRTMPLARMLPGRLVPRPSEAYAIWDRCYGGFSEPCRDLTEWDVLPLSRERARKAVLAQARYQRRPRFLAKYTGWPRLGFVNAIFPDALFVHIYRDGRAVAASHLQVRWWRGWAGPSAWRWGNLPAEWESEWARSGYSFVVLAGLQWKLLMGCYAGARSILPEQRLLELSYEQLVADPIATMSRVLEFCELRTDRRYSRYLDSVSIYDGNRKWRTDLSERQQDALTRCLERTLQEWGYAT